MSHIEEARAVWRVADALVGRAIQKEKEARKLRDEAGRLSSIAAAIADGRDVAEVIA
jgi:hypothetical protein